MPIPSKEIQDYFLKKGRNAIWAMNGTDRGPNMTPYWYLWDEETGKFLISTLDWVAKVKDLRQDPKMSLLIDDPTSNLGLYVLVYGTGVVRGPGPDAVDGSIKLIRKYRYSDEATWQHWNEINAKNDRVLVEMAPTKWIWRDV